MVTAQRQQYQSSYSAALAPALGRPEAAPDLRLRAIPKSRRREYQAWMTLLIMFSGLLLTLGVLSLYGRICQTSEINRKSTLTSQLKIADQRAQELALQRAATQNDVAIESHAKRMNMVRRTDRDAITIP